MVLMGATEAGREEEISRSETRLKEELSSRPGEAG